MFRRRFYFAAVCSDVGNAAFCYRHVDQLTEMCRPAACRSCRLVESQRGPGKHSRGAPLGRNYFFSLKWRIMCTLYF